MLMRAQTVSVWGNPCPQIHGPERRLITHEPHRGWRLEQNRNALVGGLLVLNRDADPDVGKRPIGHPTSCRVEYGHPWIVNSATSAAANHLSSRHRIEELGNRAIAINANAADIGTETSQYLEAQQIHTHALRALRQNLKGVLRAGHHDGKNSYDKFFRHILMKQIAHRIDKNPARLLPVERFFQHLRHKSNLPGPARAVRTPFGQAFIRLALPAKPMRLPHRVARFTTLADQGATSHGIPRLVGPFNRGRHVTFLACPSAAVQTSAPAPADQAASPDAVIAL